MGQISIVPQPDPSVTLFRVKRQQADESVDIVFQPW
jgi:hypothetical protein